jgi:cyclic pyranopterin phosphate synthase
LLDFAADRGVEIRFIELMRTGTEREWSESEFVPVDEVKRWLGERTTIDTISTPAGVPAQSSQLQWNGRLVRVGWIAPRSHPFCGSCERVRLDCRGGLRRCLMDPALLDLVRLRKTGDRNSAELVSRYMASKFAPNGMESESMMSQIGG